LEALELIEGCRERVAPEKIPRHLELREMLPKQKGAKLLKCEIGQEERQRLTKEEATGT